MLIKKKKRVWKHANTIQQVWIACAVLFGGKNLTFMTTIEASWRSLHVQATSCSACDHFYFFLSCTWFLCWPRKNLNQPMRFVVLEILSLFFLLQSSLFKIIYEVMDFFFISSINILLFLFIHFLWDFFFWVLKIIEINSILFLTI